ncbi:MAG: phenylacetate--CoA ligase [Candidatus Firestonebacteria bacterium RIFOXYC2_FULL_39_67]|nr:MAG: phenylacetate--CoA ligase [Candidatus Firestonebacteria bacterium RIFOXYD2_FULL_39_29]OGF54031.1 MAG: phenylacetate--CoA ligase [Candidatus Firestonebacteria bacterium RifOxyC12_full_39_7]OGF56421.1 MAG: phenylacetate--CoA ligase [Candidatus Firestonebacteria bacterium RIFOXYC2_FULL_39_67]
MIWNPKAECMLPKERELLQLERLQHIVKYAYERIPYYKRSFDAAKVKPSDIKTLKDITKLPFTSKDDLRGAYPFGMFAVPHEEILEIHTSSGTTGRPVVVGYTASDIELWSEVMARALSMAGTTKADWVQNAYGYGLFTGGLGVHYGARKIGANIVPISAGNTKRQLEIIRDFGTTILTCTPSYTLYLAEAAAEEGIDLKKSKLRSGVFGAEMWTEKMREEIEKRLNINALNIYGLTEIIGPGVGQECQEKSGLHLQEDHFFPEIIATDTLQPLAEEQKGEMVLTTLTREGTPMIRFRTKDITALKHGTCKCGRTTLKMDRITGRSDDMMKIRGVIVFPSQIEKALLEIPGIEPHYKIIITRPHQLDELEVQVETSKKMFSDEVRHVEEIKNNIENHIERAIGIRIKVTLVEPKSIQRSEGKARRVFDMRNIK